EILLLTADVNEAIDRARPAQDFSARPGEAPARQLGLRLGLELPGDLRMVNITIETGRDVDPRIAVLAAGFEHQDAGAAVGAEAVCQDAARGTGAGDDEIELSCVLHSLSPSRCQRGPQIDDDLVAGARLPAAAATDRLVLDLGHHLAGDEDRPRRAY